MAAMARRIGATASRGSPSSRARPASHIALYASSSGRLTAIDRRLVLAARVACPAPEPVARLAAASSCSGVSCGSARASSAAWSWPSPAKWACSPPASSSPPARWNTRSLTRRRSRAWSAAMRPRLAHDGLAAQRRPAGGAPHERLGEHEQHALAERRRVAEHRRRGGDGDAVVLAGAGDAQRAALARRVERRAAARVGVARHGAQVHHVAGAELQGGEVGAGVERAAPAPPKRGRRACRCGT
jgi:hypothetical protein